MKPASRYRSYDGAPLRRHPLRGRLHPSSPHEMCANSDGLEHTIWPVTTHRPQRLLLLLLSFVICDQREPGSPDTPGGVRGRAKQPAKQPAKQAGPWRSSLGADSNLVTPVVPEHREPSARQGSRWRVCNGAHTHTKKSGEAGAHDACGRWTHDRVFFFGGGVQVQKPSCPPRPPTIRAR